MRSEPAGQPRARARFGARPSLPDLSRDAIARPAAALAGILLFLFALRLVQAGAAGLTPLLNRIDASGPVNGVGFGWLFSYLTLSGSPVAAISMSLNAAGTISQPESLAMLAGSRLGASFIVLAVGYLAWRRGSRSPDGLAIGVIALLVTFATQGPALALGLLALETGIAESLSFEAPAALYETVDSIYAAPVDAIAGILPLGLVFALGVGGLLAGFALFDRGLPRIDDEAEGLARVMRVLQHPALMFVVGAVVTLTTMSVALSVTALVPLALKGYIRREHVIPYVMGANITTFVDTIFAAVILGGGPPLAVVLIEVISVAAVSAVLIGVCYRPYVRLTLAGAGWASHSSRNLAWFLAAIVAIPLVLLFV